MTKAILKKSLALLVSVMLVLTAFGGALSVFADDAVVEDTAFDYGTYEDGFNTRAESGTNDGNPTIHEVPALDIPKNLDFTEGLKFWSSKVDRYGFASEYVTISTDVVTGEAYVGFNLDNNQFDGISTPWFGLGDIADGTKIYVFAEYMLNKKITVSGSAAFGSTKNPVSLLLVQKDAQGTTTKLKEKYETAPMDDAAKNGIWSTQEVHEFNYVAGATYRVQLQDGMASASETFTTRAELAEMTDGEPAIFVKGIRFCTLNDDGTYTEIGTGEKLYKTGLPVGGTKEEGIPVNMINGGWQEIYNWGTSAQQAKNTATYIPQEGFQNGDFSDGFKYWTVRWPGKGYGINSVDDIYEIVDGYVQFKGNEKNYLGLGSVPFKLSGVKAGDKIFASANIKNTGGVLLRFDLGEVGVANVRNEYRGNTTDWINVVTPELTVSSDDAVFAIQFENQNLNAGHAIDDIRIMKVNGDGTYTNVMTGETTYADGSPIQPFGGTEADGIIANDNNYVANVGGSFDDNGYVFGVADKFTNYDFSQGFKYYSLRYNSDYDAVDSISDFAEITEQGTLKFTSNPYQFCGLVSLPFYVEGLEAGDQIVFSVDYKNNADTLELRLHENNKKVAYYTCGTKVTNWGSTATGVATVTSGDSYFWFEIQNNGDNTGMELDNLRLLKKGADGTYTDLFTGENVYSDGKLVGGTFEDGWSFNSAADNALYMGTFDEFNGDFSKGLKFWTLQNNVAVGKASDAATAVTEENGNVYVNVFDTANSWYGIRTLGFKLDNVKAGDKLTVMFNYRKGDLSKHRIFLNVANADTANDSTWSLTSADNTHASSMIIDNGDKWGTAVNKNYITVGSAIKDSNNNAYCTSIIDEVIWFYIEVENAGSNVGSIDLDNFQVVKYIDDTTVETLDGEIISFANSWYGTFEDGANVSGSNADSRYYGEYGVQNGDFSEGFKYWCAYGINNEKPSVTTHVDLVEENGNNYVKFNGKTFGYYWGFRTAKMSVPAASLAVGDNVAIMLDVYDPDNNCNTIQAVVSIYNSNGTTTRLSQCNLNNVTVIEDKGNGWKTVLTNYKVAIPGTSSATKTIAAGDWEFSLWFEVPSNQSSSAAIDNVKLVKKLGTYAALDLTNDETIEWSPAWAGTFDGGATSVGSALNSKYMHKYGIMNGDFSEGLKYWGSTGGTATAVTDHASLVADGDNYYIQLDGEPRAAYCGFRTGMISIPKEKLTVGDKVAVKFDLYVPDASEKSVQIVLEGTGMGVARPSQTTLNACKVISEKGNGWKTVITEFDAAIANESTATTPAVIATGDWSFRLIVEVISSKYDATTETWTTLNTSKACFDNFEIVEKVDDDTAVTMDGKNVYLVCEHNYESVVTDATCETEGYTTHTCSLCGDVYIDNVVEALGHSYDSVVTEATCETEGHTTHTCSVCGDVYVDNVVEALGHDYDSVVTEPTCTTDGFTTHTCANCGDTYTDSVIEGGHKYDDVVTEPTCTTDGYTTHTCSVCGDVYVDSVVPAGHKYNDIVTAPTCKTDGYTTHICTVCGYTHVDSHVDAAHNYSEWVVTDPTCVDEGYTTYTCSACGDVRVDDYVAALGHSYDSVVTEPTCDTEGYTTHTCTVCGDSYVDSTVDALGHSYGDWEVVTDATCTEAGSKQKVCGTCGDVVTEEIPATGHAYDAVVTEPTCTEQGYTTYTCANCGDSYVDNYVDALGHSYDSVVTEPTCDTEGYTTHTCSVCGDSYVDSTVAALGHNYESVVTEPTCTEDGYTTHTCTNCGDTYTDSYVDAGHKYGDWEVVTAAKPGVAGSKQKVCSVCGDVVTEEIPALSGISFHGASLVLQSNLAFNFKVDSALFADGAYANPYVVFNFNGVETVVDAYTVDGDKYVFTLYGITPDKMKDTVTATLYATFEGVEYTAVKEYSVAEYCYSMLDQYADNASLRTLVVDLLNYGAESQKYSGYKTDNLANADLTAEQAAWGTADVTINNVFNAKYEVIDNASVTWKGAGVTLLESVALRFKFRAESTEGLTVNIRTADGEWNFSGEDIIKSGDCYYVLFDKLGANKMSEEVFVTVMKDGAAVSNTARYSIESYAYAKQDSEYLNLADLVKAMMKYGNSAKNYKG